MVFFTVLGYLLLAFLLLIVFGFCFFRSTKEWPKTWYEWKFEFRLQVVGFTGLIQDYVLNNRNRVDLYKQPGKVALITGGNRGIGLIIAKKFLECDMTVIMGVRNPREAERNVAEIVDLGKIEGKLHCEKLDIGDMASVKDFAAKIKTHFKKIDILVNNAGIMFAPYKLTEDGYESHFAVNFLGHFLLTHLLLPELKAAGEEGNNSRIVNVSSIVHLIGKIHYDDINLTKRYYPPTAYNQSKLAQILFTRHLNQMLKEQGAHVQVHAVHPGVVDTDLFAHTSTTTVPSLKKMFFKTPEEGSRTVVFAAIAPKLEGRGGSYLSNCVRVQMHKDAKNPEKCEKLFKFSCELLKLENYGSGQI